MPGPLNKSRVKGSPTAPDKKAAARLKRRQDGFSKPADKYAAGYHMPGSQNRNK